MQVCLQIHMICDKYSYHKVMSTLNGISLVYYRWFPTSVRLSLRCLYLFWVSAVKRVEMISDRLRATSQKKLQMLSLENIYCVSCILVSLIFQLFSQNYNLFVNHVNVMSICECTQIPVKRFSFFCKTNQICLQFNFADFAKNSRLLNYAVNIAGWFKFMIYWLKQMWRFPRYFTN